MIGNRDDVALVTSYPNKHKNIANEIIEIAYRVGLKVNQQNIKVMRIGSYTSNNKLEIAIE